MDEIVELLKILDKKKITIEQEMVSGGCIAVPRIMVTVELENDTLTAKKIEIEDAFEEIFRQVSEK
jgi:hypothetical protein